MEVSVIIVSWNARGFLRQCLDSLRCEKGNEAGELIVVDNGSTDGSAEMVQQEFPHAKLIRSGANLGFAKANNLGIKASTKRYLALVNSDVTVCGGCMERLVKYMDEHLEAGMMGPRIVGADGKWQRTCVGYPTLWTNLCRALALDVVAPGSRLFGGYLNRYAEAHEPTPVQVIYGCFWFIRRKALDQVGLLDERFFMYGEDIDWSKRFNDKGWGVVYVPEAEAVHYGGASLANAPVKFFVEKQHADLQDWRKHHGLTSYFIYYTLCCLHHLVRGAGHAAAALMKSGKHQEGWLKSRRSLLCLLWLVGLPPAATKPGRPVARGTPAKTS